MFLNLISHNSSPILGLLIGKILKKMLFLFVFFLLGLGFSFETLRLGLALRAWKNLIAEYSKNLVLKKILLLKNLTYEVFYSLYFHPKTPSAISLF
jgi:hypothetical protein